MFQKCRSESAIDDAGPLIISKIPVGTFQPLRWNAQLNDRVNITAHIPHFEEINAPLPLLFLPMHETYMGSPNSTPDCTSDSLPFLLTIQKRASAKEQYILHVNS